MVQNRAIYDRLTAELGAVTTSRVYQTKRDHFYLDFAVLTCDCEAEVRGVARLELFCGLNSFIESIKSIKGVKIQVV